MVPIFPRFAVESIEPGEKNASGIVVPGEIVLLKISPVVSVTVKVQKFSRPVFKKLSSSTRSVQAPAVF
jgi:hypothetical protein